MFLHCISNCISQSDLGRTETNGGDQSAGVELEVGWGRHH